jgi:hypothetical protein
MKLLGKRVLVKKPVRPESTITLSDADKAIIDADLMKSYTKLTVTHVGDEVTLVKEGDLVYIGDGLRHAEIIKIEEDVFFMIPDRDIAIIWKQ